MQEFNWKAETKKGEGKKGEIEAADENAAKAQLRRQGFKNIKISKKPKDLAE